MTKRQCFIQAGQTFKTSASKISSRLASNLRMKAERLMRVTPREVAQLPLKDVEQLVQELQVHQIELEMQNDELLRAQMELEKLRGRYTDLYDLAPAAYLTLSANQEILEANLSAGHLLGVERSKLIHQEFTRFIPPAAQDTFYLFAARSLDQTPGGAWSWIW
jgi:PAS domain-containing protein